MKMITDHEAVCLSLCVDVKFNLVETPRDFYTGLFFAPLPKSFVLVVLGRHHTPQKRIKMAERSLTYSALDDNALCSTLNCLRVQFFALSIRSRWNWSKDRWIRPQLLWNEVRVTSSFQKLCQFHFNSFRNVWFQALILKPVRSSSSFCEFD